MKLKSNRLTFEWMVKDTTQGAWIEGKGMLLWLAFFFTEIGAGTYFVSLFMNFKPGLLLGWVIVLALGGFFHIVFLGKPERGWRIFNGIASSELSRGLLITLFFGVIGFFQILPAISSNLPWEGNEVFLKVPMGILCILLILHGFLTMATIKAIPMWNAPMMLPLALASGIWVGSQVVELMLLLLGLDITVAEIWVRWSMAGFMCLLSVFLWWNALHSSESASASIKRILKGDVAVIFYVWVLSIGIIIPVIITILIWVKNVSSLSIGFLLLRFLCVIVGDLMMRYCVFKGSLYRPLI